jgi:MFS family permease
MLQNFCLIYQPALFAIMLDSLSPENRGAGLTLQSVLTNIVGLPAPIIALFLISVFQFDLGMRIAYAIVTVAYFAAAILRYRLKETLPANDESRPSLLDAFRKYPKAVAESLGVWRKVPRSAFYLFIATGVVGCLFTGCNTYLLIFAKDVLGINASQWAFALAFASLTIAVPTIFAGLRMDKIGRKRFLVLGYLCYVPAMLLFVFADFYLLLIAFFFWGLGQMLQNSGYQSLMGDLTPREMRGKVVGCSQFFIYLSEAFAQILIGLVYAYVWRPLPFLMLAAGVVPVALFVFLRVKEPKAKEV